MSAFTTTAARAVAKKGAQHWPHTTPTLAKAMDNASRLEISEDHDMPTWSESQIRQAVTNNVMMTWSPGKAKHGLPLIRYGQGVYLYDDKGKRYLDWTSQAVCSNLGYTVPQTIVDATLKQIQELPFVYGGIGMSEIRARLSKLVADIMPGDLQGAVFPCSGSEANEAAIMMARRFTGKEKVINWYRGYHGGTSNSLHATGDMRRWYGNDSASGFVKAFNPYPLFFDLAGESEEHRTRTALAMLEEQILNEGPDTIALIQLESIVGSGGVLVPPDGYMQGVRALCDEYDILLHFDEVMVGFGRTGKLFGFEHFEGVLPDIVTAAKGISSSVVPLSMCATRKHIMDAFDDKPLGWGSTYQAHPVAMACAYANIKYLIKENIIGNVQRLESVFESSMKSVAENHPCVKQYRHIGMFGCFDAHNPDGSNPQLQHTAASSAFAEYKQACTDNGLIGLLRPPNLHVAPPLNINEEELLDRFERQDKALYALDEALGF